jgi:hypothetical protein
MTTLYLKAVKTTVFTASGTWTKDLRTKQLLVETLGGGGGGRVTGTGTTGGTSSFGAFISAAGGGGAVAGGVLGGAASLAAGRFSFPGDAGSNYLYWPATVTGTDIGVGGGCYLSPPRYMPGGGYYAGSSGWTGAAESNRGCGGGTSSNNAGLPWGGGGGAYTAGIFNRDDVTDSVTVTIGAGGAGATGGFAGGAGLVIVTEFF